MARFRLAGRASTLAIFTSLALSRPARASDDSLGASGRSWLGVAMASSPDSHGVSVSHVLRGSPAERSGLHDGDTLRAIDGKTVLAPADVSHIIARHEPGEMIVAKVSRGEGSLSLKIALAARPSSYDMVRMDRVGTVAPTWTGVEPVGTAPATMVEMRGKVVLLDFWATWCAPCRVLAPTLSALQARYGAQGLRVVGMATEPAEQVALFAQRAEMHYALAVDSRGETARAYDIAALPTLFVIDKRGIVRDVAIGYDPSQEDRIEALIRQLLAEPVAAP